MKTTVIDKYISCATPAGTSNELDVQNGWEENTYTYCGTTDSIDYIVPGTRFYVVMSHQILYFLQNLFIPLLLFTNKKRSSSKRRMDRGIADET